MFHDVVLSDKAGKKLFESPRVHTKVSLFGLLRGLLSLNISAEAYGGELSVKARQGPGIQYLLLDATGLDVGAYPLLKDIGMRLSGKLGGNFEMTGDAGKGRLWLTGLTTRELKIKGFPVPDLDFEQGWLEGELKADRLSVKKLELEGKDLKLRVTGDMVLNERGNAEPHGEAEALGAAGAGAGRDRGAAEKSRRRRVLSVHPRRDARYAGAEAVIFFHE